MHSQPEVSVYLEIPATIIDGNLTRLCSQAIAKYSASLPTNFYLPWNSLAIPEANEMIALYACTGDFEELFVHNKSYALKDGRVIVYVQVGPNRKGYSYCVPRDVDIFHLARIGALCENIKTSIATALSEAGIDWQ